MHGHCKIKCYPRNFKSTHFLVKLPKHEKLFSVGYNVVLCLDYKSRCEVE